MIFLIGILGCLLILATFNPRRIEGNTPSPSLPDVDDSNSSIEVVCPRPEVLYSYPKHSSRTSAQKAHRERRSSVVLPPVQQYAVTKTEIKAWLSAVKEVDDFRRSTVPRREVV